MQLLITAFCGLLIGLAVYLFYHCVKKMAQGRCCEGCSGCPRSQDCEVGPIQRNHHISATQHQD